MKFDMKSFFLALSVKDVPLSLIFDQKAAPGAKDKEERRPLLSKESLFSKVTSVLRQTVIEKVSTCAFAPLL